jgi:hypothetical protein
MSSNGNLAEFAARLRGIVEACNRAPDEIAAEVPSFNQLALDLFGLQFAHNAAYRRFCEARHARPGTVDHWTDIPAVSTIAFKEWDLSCLPVRERTTIFHSSGTTGQQPSRHFHSAASLAVYEESLWAWFKAHCSMANGQWQRPLILTPHKVQAPHSSLVHMFEIIRRELGASESSFVGRIGEDGGWSLDLDAAIQILRKASATGQRSAQPSPSCICWITWLSVGCILRFRPARARLKREDTKAARALCPRRLCIRSSLSVLASRESASFVNTA